MRATRGGSGRWLAIVGAVAGLGAAAAPARGVPPPAPFCGSLGPPPTGEDLLLVTDASSCTSVRAVGRVPNGAAETVASLDGRTLHLVYADQSYPANSMLVSVVEGACQPRVQLNVQAAAGIASHDAPSVFVDGQGYVYATYHGATNGPNGPLLRKSHQPFVPRTFGTELPSRLFNGAEVHGFTGRDGAVYLIGNNVHTRLDVIEPNGTGGVVRYRWPQGPVHVVTLEAGELAIPGCPGHTTTGTRFTKGYVTAGVTSDGESILLAVWGWGSGIAQGCPDIQAYGNDSHEVYFAWSRDGGHTWWNRAGSAWRNAPHCSDPVSCSDPDDGIRMDDPAFVLTTTRQRDKRAAWYDDETDTVYLAFAKSTWCDRGICLEPDATDPGALMLLRFQLGAGSVVERKVMSGDYTHIPAIRRAPDGRIFLYASTSNGLYHEHVSDDDGVTWSRKPIGMLGRVHGHATLPCAPSTIVTAGAVSNRPFSFFGRTLARVSTFSFSPVADAYVHSGSPGSNYRGAVELRLRSGSPTYRGYLRFAVSGVTAPVERATLRLFVTDDSPDGGSVYPVSSSWSETGLTWSNAPAIGGAALDAAGSATSGEWVELDVTSAVTGNGSVSFGLQSASSNSVRYGSRENGNPPELVVEVEPEARACSDGLDNDGDGLIDHPADPSCKSARWTSEEPGHCGLGFEVAFLLAALRRARLRGRGAWAPRAG